MSALSRSTAPLRHRNYRLLFLSFVVSMLGDGVWLVALPWVAMELGGTSSDLSMVVGAEAAGLISCVLVGGALADRFPRKAVIGWSFAAACGTLGVLGAVHAAGRVEVWHLVTAAFVLGAAAAISGPAADAATPDLVPEKDLHAANALESIVRSLAVRMIGPAIGGLLISLFDALSIILVNAASFGVALACVAAIRTDTGRPARPGEAPAPEQKQGQEQGQGQGQEQDGAPVRYRQALRYLGGERWLWVLIVWSGLVLLLQSGPRQVLMPFLIHNDMGGDARDYGLLIAVTGVAAVVASFLVGSRTPPRDYPRWMLLAWTAGAAPLALMVFLPSFWLLLPLGAVYGFCSTVGNVYWSTLVQSSVPSAVRGRVISIDWLGSLALVPLSALLAGVSAGRAFTVWLFVLGGVVPVLLTLATLRWVVLPTSAHGGGADTEDTDTGGADTGGTGLDGAGTVAAPAHLPAEVAEPAPAALS
ncbi:MFS transporter [Kitasatospora putterlickiae]|uniref:MFS transporter n=2 Tax=Kitasatospora putterlickiae TaxID=221725 RepID=A0ABN1YF26_9ACTN